MSNKVVEFKAPHALSPVICLGHIPTKIGEQTLEGEFVNFSHMLGGSGQRVRVRHKILLNSQPGVIEALEHKNMKACPSSNSGTRLY